MASETYTLLMKSHNDHFLLNHFSHKWPRMSSAFVLLTPGDGAWEELCILSLAPGLLIAQNENTSSIAATLQMDRAGRRALLILASES